jgi:hypothetical protein
MIAVPYLAHLLLLLVALGSLALGHPREPNPEQYVLTEDAVEPGFFTEGADEVREEYVIQMCGVLLNLQRG